MKFKLLALSMLAGMAFVSFSSNVVAKDAASSFNEYRRGYILFDPITGAQDDSNCNPAPVGVCWYKMA